MVFFTCNACGETVKKIRVEFHVERCRQCQCLSCIDCGKDFWGNDYKAHNACITEEEKYSGKNYQPKVYKGEQKQEMWMEAIRSTIGTITEPQLKNHLEHVLTFSNIPRKRSKFENFLRGSVHIINPELINEIWQVFSSAFAMTKNQSLNITPQATNIQSSQNSINAVNNSENKAKKNKRECKEERKKKTKVEKNDKNLEVQHSNGIQNSDSKIELNEESTTKENLKKVKKPKKHKHQMNDEEVANNGTDTTPREETIPEIGIIETKQKDKKLGDKHSSDGKCEPNQESTTNENLNKVKKHKKKRKHQIIDVDVGTNETTPHEETIPEIVITEKKKKNKKRHLSDITGDDMEKEVSVEEPANKKQKGEEISETSKPERFQWVPVIRSILEKAESKELPIKRVKKKVVAEYMSRCQGRIFTKQEIQAKFLKRIERNPIFRLHKERIKLIEN